MDILQLLISPAVVIGVVDLIKRRFPAVSGELTIVVSVVVGVVLYGVSLLPIPQWVLVGAGIGLAGSGVVTTVRSVK